MKKIILLFAMMLAVGTASADRKYATFGTPGGNASYSEATYTWTATNNNLMTVFEFSNGELANFNKLKFTIGNLTSGTMVRMGYYVGSTFTEFGSGYGSNGAKEVDLTTLGIDLTTVTKIAFGGRTGTGSVDIAWSQVYLENADDAVVTAAFATPASSATYKGTTYSATAGNNNLMDVYTKASDGEFSRYGVLQFDLGTVTSGMFRIGFHDGSTFTMVGSSDGYGSAGTKTIDLSSYSSAAASATTIKFGSKDKAGTAVIEPNKMFLVRSEAYTRSFTKDQKSTVWLPFALTAEDVAAVKGKFYELTAAADNSLTFKEVTGATEAYKPYVFVASEDGTPFSEMKTKTIVAPKTCSYTVGDFTFVGSMKDTKVPKGAYGYNATNGEFSKTTSADVTIAPFRAYIVGPANATGARLAVVFSDGETTGIQTVNQPQTGDSEAMYNLQGQRVGEGHKGLVIKNGRKWIIR